VQAACNGVEALHLFAGGIFDVILMDMHMPEMDGLSATRALRDIEHREGLDATPVIALTASVQAADRQAALHAGMNGFATKPVVVAQLYTEIARVLDLQITPVMQDAVPLADEVIDSRRGLSLWRTTERLHGAIAAFLASQADTPRTLRGAMMQGDHEALTSLAHKISGTSGNLALARLRSAAHALELAARNSADYADANEVLAGVQSVIDELQAVAACLPQAAPQSVETASCTVADGADYVDPEALQAMFARLRASLMDSTFDDATLQDVTDALPTVRVAGLVEAIDQFDFQGAVRHLDALQHAATPDITTICPP
jgi:CheY-like chemotaxis protein